jgi:hypothetical protein
MSIDLLIGSGKSHFSVFFADLGEFAHKYTLVNTIIMGGLLKVSRVL